MRYRLLAIAAIAGAIAAPIAAQAQGVVTTGVARGPLVVTDDAYGIAVDDQRAANTSFASACRTTPFRIA